MVNDPHKPLHTPEKLIVSLTPEDDRELLIFTVYGTLRPPTGLFVS